MTKIMHLKFPAILLVLLAAYNQCQAQCPRLTHSNPDFGITISYDRAMLGQFATATYSDCDGESGLVNFGNSGSRSRVCNFDPVTPRLFWSGEEPTCRVLLCEDGVLERLFPMLSITYSTPLLPAIHEGDPPAGGYRGGTRADYTCPPTYGVSGQSFDLCQQNLRIDVLLSVNWDIQNRTCERQCPLLNDGSQLNFRGLSAGISYDPASRVPGTIARYECLNSVAFIPNGTLERECIANASISDTPFWTDPEPNCIPICQDHRPLENGVITYDPDEEFRFIGTVATYTCNEGFTYDGVNTNGTCLTSAFNISGEIVVFNSFTPPATRCILEVCPLLPSIPNGNITYGPDMTADFDVGTIATHTCNDGYSLFGFETRECVLGGRWNRLPPVCIARCPALQPIPNGVLTYGPTFTPSSAAYFDQGTLALYTCHAGFMLVGSESQLCLAGGIWSSQPPVCQPIQCPPLPMFPNGMITYSSGPLLTFPVGTEAVYQCNAPEGYCLPAGATLRECQPSGTWSGVEPEPCGRISCALLEIINGEVVYSDESQIQDGTTANQTCREGFVLTGSRVRTCIGVSQTPVICGEFMGNWTGPAGMCVGDFVIVNDTAIGDPLMTVPLNIADKTSFFEASINNNIGPNDIINLCYELHGRRDAFVNLVSDECVSVNAHYELVQPNEPREDINIIDNIHVRATDSIGRCRNIGVALNEGGVCTASVDGANIADMYQANGISIRRYTNRVRIMVPNCEDVNLVMWVFCRQSTFWSTFRTDNNGAELTFQADMIKFVIARGFNLRESSHGIIGQFWNIPILVEPFTGSIRSSASTDNLYQVTIQHPNERREFTAWLYRLTWEYRQEYCLYAGNQQAGSVYEVVSPNDPVIEGTYADYIVDTAYGTDFAFTHFNEGRCN